MHIPEERLLTVLKRSRRRYFAGAALLLITADDDGLHRGMPPESTALKTRALVALRTRPFHKLKIAIIVHDYY